MTTDNELVEWSENYKQCLNTHSVRHRLVDRPGTILGYVEVSEGSGRIVWTGQTYLERGTIEFKYLDGQTAHYLTYFPGNDRKTCVFDPSYSTQHPGGFNLDPWMIRGLNRIFGVGRYYMFYQVTPVQMLGRYGESDDGWCQSWSLTMLHPVLQNRVKGWAMEPDADFHSRRPQAYEIVARFASYLRRRDFEDALPARAVSRAWDLHVRVYRDLEHNWWRMYTDSARTTCTPRRRTGVAAWRMDEPPDGVARNLWPAED